MKTIIFLVTIMVSVPAFADDAIVQAITDGSNAVAQSEEGEEVAVAENEYGPDANGTYHIPIEAFGNAQPSVRVQLKMRPRPGPRR